MKLCLNVVLFNLVSLHVSLAVFQAQAQRLTLTFLQCVTASLVLSLGSRCRMSRPV